MKIQNTKQNFVKLLELAEN